MLRGIGVTVPVLQVSLHSCHAGRLGTDKGQVASVIVIHAATTRWVNPQF